MAAAGYIMRRSYDLTGKWSLRLDEEQTGCLTSGMLELRNKSGLQTGFNDTIVLPATTAMAEKTLHGINDRVETFFLTEKYPFAGCVWYQREVHIEPEDIGKPSFLYLERTRMSRLWINGEEMGSCDSICAPHCYNVTSAMKTDMLRITICIKNVDYPTGGGHMTSKDTQTNWNGILGKMELRVYETADVLAVSCETDAKTGTLRAALDTVSIERTAVLRKLKLRYYYETVKDEKLTAGSVQQLPIQELEIEPGINSRIITLTLPQVRLFSEFQPGFGRLELYCGDGEKEVTAVFGFREFTVDRHHFYINGVRTFLRGKHDGMVFPLTGAAPMDIGGWMKVLSVSKSFGINHYRFHTCCPPEAAFYAADLLGIYMEPELPFWGTIAAPGEEGYHEEEQNYLIAEGFRLMKAYGGHPSFVMMSLGNELWGSGRRLGEILNAFRAVDQRHLYTSGSNNFQFYPFDIPEEDFFAGVRFDVNSLIRGSYAMCDAPQGFVQMEEPNTVHSYDSFFDVGEGNQNETAAEEIEIQYGTGVKKVKKTEKKVFTTDKPILSHEVGQYCTYPDFKEISHYTGVLEARNLEEFRRRLESAGMLDQAEEFFQASGALAAFCYKLEIEAAHRSRMLAGYQLLDLQDFPGQGTALVGVLNSLMEEKGIITKEEFCSFCNETVVLAELPRFVYSDGEVLAAELLVSHYGAQPLQEAVITAVLCRQEKEEIILSRSTVTTEKNGVYQAGSVRYELPVTEKAAHMVLELKLCDRSGCLITKNSYQLYSYPVRSGLLQLKQKFETEMIEHQGLYVTCSPGRALEKLKEGGSVLLFPKRLKKSIPGTFCTDFWCYPMFRSISESMNRPLPVGTLGLTIQHQHPSLNGFASASCSTPQWYAIVKESEAAILSGTALKPIVQVIDNFERNHKLGMIFEAKCAGGRLLVCTSHLERLTDNQAAENLYQCLLRYGTSELFAPEEELTGEEFETILGE